MTPTLYPPLLPIRVDGFPSKMQVWLVTGIACECGRHQWGWKNVLVLGECWEIHSCFQALWKLSTWLKRQTWGIYTRVKIFCPFMCHLLKNTHHKFEFVFGNDNGLGDIRLLPFRLRTPSWGSSVGSRQSTLSARTFSACFSVVLVKPLLVSLVHVIREASSNAVKEALVHGLRSRSIIQQMLFSTRRWWDPSIDSTDILIVCNNARRVGCGNKSCRWRLQLGLVRQSGRNIWVMGGRKDFLQVIFL